MNSRPGKSALMGVVALFILGCEYPEVENLPALRSAEDSALLRHSCQEISKHGDFTRASLQVDQAIQQLKSQLHQGEINLETVKALATDIREQTQTMIRLTAPQFSTIDQNQDLNWNLGLAELGPTAKGFRLNIDGIIVEKLFDRHGEAEHLREFIEIFIDGPRAKLHLYRPASLLELCQLQKSIAMIVRVNFTDGQTVYSKRFTLITRAEGEN